MKMVVLFRFLCFLLAAAFSLSAAHTELFSGKRFLSRMPRLKPFTRITRTMRRIRRSRLSNRRDDPLPSEIMKSEITSSSPETLKDDPTLVYTSAVNRKRRTRAKRCYRGNRMGRKGQGIPESFISISVPQENFTVSIFIFISIIAAPEHFMLEYLGTFYSFCFVKRGYAGVYLFLSSTELFYNGFIFS